MLDNIKTLLAIALRARKEDRYDAWTAYHKAVKEYLSIKIV